MSLLRESVERLVRVPSVDGAAVTESAKLTAEMFRTAGAAAVDIVSAGGAPAVIADFPGPQGSPTVLLYAHHDVQLAGSGWRTPPFEPVELAGRLYGRGTADDKGGIAVHLAALHAYGGRPPVGVTVFVEGEEETGSATLPAILREHRQRLAADLVVLADGDNWDTGQPALTVGLRGLVDCTMTVSTLTANVHSGMYGGVAPDALTALCRMVASLHDDTGEVAVTGLHRGSLPTLAITDERIRAESGMLPTVRSVGRGSIADRLWNQPAASVLEIAAPPAGNVLHASVRAKIGLRVPPGGSAAAAYAALRRHLLATAPWGVEIDLQPGEFIEPCEIDTSGPGYSAAHAAFRHAWGVGPVHVGSGGSIPLVAQFAAAYPDAEILVTGVADPASNPHGPNESVDLGDLAKAAVAETELLRLLRRPSR